MGPWPSPEPTWRPARRRSRVRWPASAFLRGLSSLSPYTVRAYHPFPRAAGLSSLVWSAPQFGNLCIRDRPPPLRVTPQVEDCLHAFDLVFDHRLRTGAVHLEAQDAEVRLCTQLSVGNDSQGLTEPRWRDTRLQQVI